ncbi:methionyl-tRNA formyltransferase [Candidatus Microgenomates bacterium]|nr:methionyl-tRNA formyltransferase [Candidatus Microgenomates bacterium]
MKVVFLGTPLFIQPIKDELTKHFQLVDSLSGADPDLIGADLGVVASYGRILTKQELNTPKYGFINVHPSLLPKYRGPSPIQTAILNNDKISGITIIKMDEEVDHGPILYQEKMELSGSDNFDILSKKMFLRASEILPKIIEDFAAGKIKPTPQDHAKATSTRRLTKQDGFIDINNPPPPDQLDRMIRAYYPWPGVWTKFEIRNSKFEILKFLPGQKIQVEGGKPMSVKDFINGYPSAKGIILSIFNKPILPLIY